MFTFWFATIVFFGTYIIIASEKVHKTTAALLGAGLMMLVVLQGPVHEAAGSKDKAAVSVSRIIEKSLNAREALTRHVENSGKYENLDVFARYINFDVIFTLAGMMLLVNILSGTGIFQYIAIMSAKIARGSPIRTMILLVVATALLSAFLDNVTTVLLIAPVTLLVAAELGVPAIPFLMAETMASNIGGTATLIGDPPNLIIGSVARLDFAAFLINLSPFILLILAIYCVCLKFYYSKRMSVTVEQRARIMELDEKAAITDHSNMRRGGIVMIITIIGFLIHGTLHIQPCVIAMSGAALGLLVCKVDVDHALEKIEWNTLFFFMGLFAVVSGAEYAGLMKKFGSLLTLTEGWNVLAVVLLVMWVSGIAAALMNNVSFTAAMVTVVYMFLASSPNFNTPAEKELMWWGLALAVCLGGNGTLVGAAANLVTTGIAEKNGHRISFGEFLRYGIPVTLFSLIASSIYVTIRYFTLCR
ncbi:ArsB/NhaD family transporter [Lentisphaerota bacterium ZTH]|nr:ArsB/NhaD family transporter [Lentisphaerota bacterium]WET06122.1 ArsB/NhaD family transporter [Lentisphaerota bacterium ZTH]